MVVIIIIIRIKRRRRRVTSFEVSIYHSMECNRVLRCYRRGLELRVHDYYCYYTTVLLHVYSSMCIYCVGVRCTRELEGVRFSLFMSGATTLGPFRILNLSSSLLTMYSSKFYSTESLFKMFTYSGQDRTGQE